MGGITYVRCWPRITPEDDRTTLTHIFPKDRMTLPNVDVARAYTTQRLDES